MTSIERMPMSEVKMDRDRWVAGTQLLLSVLEDDLAIAKAIRAGKFYELHAAAVLARKDVPPEMAMTDPVRYKALRQAITIFFLKGYRCLDIEKLEQSSRSGSRASLTETVPA